MVILYIVSNIVRHNNLILLIWSHSKLTIYPNNTSFLKTLSLKPVAHFETIPFFCKIYISMVVVYVIDDIKGHNDPLLSKCSQCRPNKYPNYTPFLKRLL